MALATVIIPTHNRDALLSRAINSALGQTVRDIEIIVIDDGSSDQTVQVVQTMMRWDDRLRFLKLPIALGRSGGLQRNEAIKTAKGKYICYLDDDDVYTPWAVEARAQHLEENEDLDFCWGQTFLIRAPAAGHKLVEHQIVERLVPFPNKDVHWIDGTVIPNEFMHRAGMLGEKSGLWWSSGRGEDRRLMDEILDAGLKGEPVPVTTSIYGRTSPFNPKKARQFDRGEASRKVPAPARLPATRTDRLLAREAEPLPRKRDVRGRR